VKLKRTENVFHLVRPFLEKRGLPEVDLENLTSIDNLEYSLLCLEQENFDKLFGPKEVNRKSNGAIETLNDDINKLEDLFAEGESLNGIFKQLEQSFGELPRTKPASKRGKSKRNKQSNRK
jgi:hypothetical protein